MQKRTKKTNRHRKAAKPAKKYLQLPQSLQELGPSYRALVRELAKR